MSRLSISVVIPVYRLTDKEALLCAVRSITIEQSLQPDEIIIVSDGNGTDHLKAYIQENLSLDIVFVGYSVNRGPGFARNYGIGCATKDLVAVMDSDDLACSNRLELQLAQFAANPNLSICGGYIREYDFSCCSSEPLDVYVRTVPLTKDQIYLAVKIKSPFNSVTVMFKRECYFEVGGYPPMRSSEDYYLWANFVAQNKNMLNIKSVLCDVDFGTETIDRRKGLKYFIDDASTQAHMYNLGIINPFVFFRNLLLYFVFRLLPKPLIRSIYMKVLRS